MSWLWLICGVLTVGWLASMVIAIEASRKAERALFMVRALTPKFDERDPLIMAEPDEPAGNMEGATMPESRQMSDFNGVAPAGAGAPAGAARQAIVEPPR
jgi:hypothetical protein